MKEIQTKSGKILCVEVPKNVLKYSLNLPRVFNDYYRKDNPDDTNEYLIIGLLSELTDKDCEEFVDKIGYKNPFSGEYEDIKYKWYDAPRADCYKNSAKESFISLLQSEGINTSKECLIIKVL